MVCSFVARKNAHFIAIFIIALAVLAYQVLLTRLFSVMLYYHFAFAGVTLVMLGLTIGAQHVYLHAERFSEDRLEMEWAKAAMRFSLSSVLLALWFMYSPLMFSSTVGFAVVISSLILFAIPFAYSGICITLILTRSSFSIGKLYAADLTGAAMGCAGIVAILFLLDPISIFFALAALIAFSAYLMAPKEGSQSVKAMALAAVWGLACLLQSGLYLAGHDHLRLVWAKGHRQEHILFERWNAFSRIRVAPYSIRHGHSHPFGWGFGHPQKQDIDQLSLDIDADAETTLTRFDGHDLRPFAFLDNDVINMAYHIRPVSTVAVIGVGGGRDIMSALYFGVKHVTGIEINPAIFEALTQKFAGFTGYLYQRPDVTLVNAEARSWLNQSHQSFGLIQISLIDTWAATAAGGLTMSENKLYTVDAWEDFLAHLDADGMLSVSRWFDPVGHKAEFYRLLSLAAETLKARGVQPADIRSHIMAFNTHRIITVVASPGPFTPAQEKQARAAAAQEGFTVMLDSRIAWDATSDTIVSGKATPGFYDGLAVDVTAPVDNRPFFFYTWRPSSILLKRPNTGGDPNMLNNIAVLIMAALLVSTFVCTCVFVIEPLQKMAHKAPVKKMLPYLGYFAGIGLGFMLIEISQMQRLMVFLGHPVYGLTVVLFSLLLFGGIGSATVRDVQGALWVRPALLCAVLCVTGLITPGVAYGLKASGVPVRILASVALLAPAGFCMGMMFPTGMIMSKPFQEQQAWFWGVNGATSVFASVLGMAVSMEYGIAQAYWAGVVCYVLCLLLVLRHAKH